MLWPILEDSCFYSSVPAEAVTTSFHGWCCPMNRKVKSFKQCFYRISVQYQKLQQVFEEQFFGFDTGIQAHNCWHDNSSSFTCMSVMWCVSMCFVSYDMTIAAHLHVCVLCGVFQCALLTAYVTFGLGLVLVLVLFGVVPNISCSILCNFT